MIHLHVPLLQEEHFCIGRSLAHFHRRLNVGHGRLHTEWLLLLQSHACAERRDERARIDLGDVHIRLAVIDPANKHDENAKAVEQMMDTGHVESRCTDCT